MHSLDLNDFHAQFSRSLNLANIQNMDVIRKNYKEKKLDCDFHYKFVLSWFCTPLLKMLGHKILIAH